MRLIDADKLILHLNDWALQESFFRDMKSTVTYRTIQECIKAVEEQTTAFDAEEANKTIRTLYETLKEVCESTRNKYVQEDVCGLCQYGDCVYKGAEGEYIGECPGFDSDDCFCINKEYKEFYRRAGGTE